MSDAATKSSLYVEPQWVTDLSSCMFYHSMDIPGYGLQEGHWDLRDHFADYIGDVDCAGRRVLDVGCASGFLSFSAEAAGASEVVSFDMDDVKRQHLLPFHRKDYFRNYSAWHKAQTAYIGRWHNAYWLAHRAYSSRARVYHGDVYDLPSGLGSFDVVIVGAILEHLADPIRALASISRRCAGTLIINSEVIESEEPIARFAGNADRPDFDYVFWVYSLGIYRHVLKMLGFEITRTVKREFRFNDLGGLFFRTAIVAERAET